MPTFNAFNSAMFKAEVIDGALTETDLAVAGIGTDDLLLMVIHQDVDGALLADLSSETAVTSAGNIQTSTTSTFGDKLLVVWLDVSSAES